ncbi:MAG TPA: homocysteine S-methyltransferase family protein [Chloroflexota bacterium]|nr:homocysteine S-methyltransferase family protein [Chloroflexota bacterium]
MADRNYATELKRRVLVFDGSMGANLQVLDLSADDFGGARFEGCMDALCLTRPDAPAQLHRGFLAAGCDVVETNTFQASRLRLAEWGLADKTLAINQAGAAIARRECDVFEQQDGRPRFVAGAIGPTGLLPSSDDPTLSAIRFGQLVEIFEEQTRGLLDGGADLLIIETQQDILETKAVLHGARRAFASVGRSVPVQVQVSLDTNGRMLLGTDVGAALAILEGLGADIIGLNCSTGPEHMREPIRYLTQNTRLPISVIPNAGIPINLGGGKAHYPLDATGLADALEEFVDEFGVNVVGGCCGTTFEHLRAVVERLGDRPIRPRLVSGDVPRAASSIRAFDLRQNPPPTIVGERVNSQGSRKVKRLLLGDDYDGVLTVARDQMDGGAHLLDVCVALTERGDESHQMVEVVKRLRSSVEAPLVLDSTEREVLAAALEAYPGRAILNSFNLEAGREKADYVLGLAKQHGAYVVAMTIDEEGMAHTADRKVEIASRIFGLATVDHRLPASSLIFDVLTFPVTTGQEDLRDDARQTIEGIRRVKAELPGVLTLLGLSNVSFGISQAARGVLNSAFLYHCVDAGLDLAIVNPVHLTPYAEIEAEHRALAEDLIYNRREDALPRFLAAFEGVDVQQQRDSAEDADADKPVDERIHGRILHRKKEGIEALLDQAIAERLAPPSGADPSSPDTASPSAAAAAPSVGGAAVAVLNDVLLPAMKDVGDRFGAGELILPFVLQSAEVMKRSVSHLEQYLAKQADYSKGSIVVATVYGDVHDIGKSLLITILSNNGYTVHDLGKQVPVNTIVEAAIEKHADVIGLSALLVSTSKQMPLCIQELDRRGIHLPVLIGGAAINRAFGRRAAVLPDGRIYEPAVFYCKDVFEGLSTMDTLIDPQALPALVEQVRAEIATERDRVVEPAPLPRVTPRPGAGPRRDAPVPKPPFWGARRVPADLQAVWQHLDRNTLFRHHWGGHRAKGAEYDRIVAEVFEPELTSLTASALAEGWLEPLIVAGYFPANSAGDELIVFDPERQDQEVARLQFPRQPDGERLCLADYFRPVESGGRDVVVFQAVSAGPRAGAYVESLQQSGDYSRMLYVNGLASGTAEALADYANELARRDLGLAANQGLRFSWGYAACPDLAEQQKVLPLLHAQEEIGLTLSLSNNLDPEHSTAAIVLHHPEAKYFAVRNAA